MEPCTYKAEMITLINELLELFEGCENSDNWTDYFIRMRGKIENGEDIGKICRYILRATFSGMGSLSDLCLYKNGKPAIEESNTLQLFLIRIGRLCKSAIVELRTDVIDLDEKRQERNK